MVFWVAYAHIFLSHLCFWFLSCWCLWFCASLMLMVFFSTHFVLDIDGTALLASPREAYYLYNNRHPIIAMWEDWVFCHYVAPDVKGEEIMWYRRWTSCRLLLSMFLESLMLKGFWVAYAYDFLSRLCSHIFEWPMLLVFELLMLMVLCVAYADGFLSTHFVLDIDGTALLASPRQPCRLLRWRQTHCWCLHFHKL